MSALRDLARRARQLATRRLAPVDAATLDRAQPVSRRFGMDRGQPIDRHYIEAFLRRHQPRIRGNVMEIGGSRYARMFGRDVQRLDVLHATADNAEATLVGDLTDPASLPAESVDCLICTQTLGFIFDVQAAVAGIHHVLRPGGSVLATVGGISQVSRYDMDRWGDYWRFTDAAVRRLFGARFGANIEIATFGNVAVSLAFLQGIAVEDLHDRGVLDVTDPDYQLVIGIAARRT
jgi:SAM-dependent methyltransferase